jgi:C4-dicarboxylate-specific signal transduction histidine kinase
MLREQLANTCYRAGLSSLLLVLIYQIPFFTMLKSDPAHWVLVIVLCLSYSVRIGLSTLKELPDRIWLGLHTMVIGTHSICWSLLLLNSVSELRHQYDEYVVYSFMILAGLNAAASYALSISKRDFYVFVTPILMAQAICLFLNDYPLLLQLSGLFTILLFFFFLSYQRQQSEQIWLEQRTLNYELQKIIDAVPGGISVLMSGKYKITNQYINELSLGHGDLVGQSLIEINDRNQQFRSQMLGFMQSTDQRAQFETALQVGGELRTHLVTATKLSPIEIIISTTDIHEKKLFEQQMTLQKLKLESSSKMAALGEMAGGLAHEINNPVAIISGKAQQLMLMIKHQQAEPETIYKGLEDINKTSDRITRIVKSLRNFSHGDADNESFSVVSLQAIIDETLSFCEAKFKNYGVQFSTDIPTDIQLQCRPVQISQVLLNALNNSYDAVIQSSEKSIRIEAQIHGRFVHIQVIDSGPGIPTELRDKIMEPFFSTKEVGQGIGLGLSISKGIINSHQGEIYFDYRSQQTVLVITLPLRQISH